MIQTQTDREESLSLDLTPLLDLIFIVMVFLLLSTNVQVQTMEINVPQTEESNVLSVIEKQVITINILAGESRWALDSNKYQNWGEFTSALLQTVKTNPDKELIIAADKSADVQSMLRLLAFLQKNHIQTTNIVMEENTL
ncbi:ExbD/TolR family protein [Vibrio sp. SCSIO 43137]|uniref:ExbD/TolR family protein n=1 Tax=Vibrio sp. SCSIO 43137 TaxID=3021011 RepID=UPI00230735C6|nr:biopolymer transporter ExbD [Vibrio sp. SCSIO 43137]WCE30617.1 biopolymer transporter ExbD [Vibrio sp. SCSIO 43137]